MVREQLEQILVRSKVDFGAAAIGFNDLGGAAVGRQEHPTDLVILDTLNKIAVTQGACFRLRATGTAEESGGDHDDRQHQQGT